MFHLVLQVTQADEGIDWAGWITAGATAATGLILAITGWAAWGALRDAKRTRHAQLVIALNWQWASETMKQSQKLYATYTDVAIAALIERLWKPNHPDRTKEDEEAYNTLARLSDFIENIGVLEADRAITIDVIYNNWGAGIVATWDAWDLAVPKLRKLTTQRDAYQNFERVGLAVKAIYERRLIGS